VDIKNYFSSDGYWRLKNQCGQTHGFLNMTQSNAERKRVEEENKKIEEAQKRLVGHLLQTYGTRLYINQNPQITPSSAIGIYARITGKAVLDVNDYWSISQVTLPKQQVINFDPIPQRSPSQNVTRELKDYFRYRFMGK